MIARVLVASLVVLAAPACGDEEPTSAVSPIAPDLAEFELTSPAFEEGGAIPDIYSCDGEDVSPPLEWSGVPEGAAELVLTLLDPDANRVFTHWTVFSIDPASMGAPEGSPPEGALEGQNDFGETGYGGPCPPRGESHRYVFTLGALSEPSGLETGASPSEVDDAVGGAFATTTLTGSYAG